jgi:hypothetical protein
LITRDAGCAVALIVARLQRHPARRGGEVLIPLRLRVDDRARGIDHHAGAVRRAARPHGRLDVAALGADARHQQRHVAHHGAHLRQLLREGGADHQRALAVAVPLVGHQLRHVLVQRAPAHVEELQVGAARIRGAAQHDHAAVRPFHIRFHRIEAHVGADRDGIGAVAVEGFARVLARGGADVAALGVQDQRDVRIRSFR